MGRLQDGRGIRSTVARSRFAGPAGYILRSRAAAGQVHAVMRNSVRGVRGTRETTNYNYDLEHLNRYHLAWWTSAVASIPVSEALVYFGEIEQDGALREHLRTTTTDSEFRWVSDADPALGRRVAWYALVRALKPATIVETGIDKGLGTCILATAARRNGAGHVWAIDAAPKAGWLVAGDLAKYVTLQIGDASFMTATVPGTIDLHIHDVHASLEQEKAEMDVVMNKVRPGSIVVNDNAHSYAVLPDIAAAANWPYFHFQERPVCHWHPGAGMGGVRVK